MIKGRGMMSLDGDFRHPIEKFAVRQGPAWVVVSRGPSYVNQYEITEFDEAGERWLKANDRTDVPVTASRSPGDAGT